jgi:hypothetical protein
MKFNSTRRYVKRVATNGSYSSGQVIGSMVEMESRSPGLGGIIISTRVVDTSNQKKKITAYFFSKRPQNFADKGAFSINRDDAESLLGSVTVAEYSTLNSLGIGASSDHVPFVSPDAVLYIYLVASEAVNLGSNGVSLSVTYWAD